MARKKIPSDDSFVLVSRAQLESWRAKLKGTDEPEVPVPDASKLSAKRQRLLTVVVIIALVVGVYLVGRFFSVIVLSLLATVLFSPLYERINRRLKRPGTSAMLTFMLMLLLIIIPLTIILFITVGQIQQLITELTNASKSVSLSDAATHLLDSVNKFLASVTNGHYQLSVDQVRDYLTKAAAAFAGWFLGLLTASFSGIANFITQLILFIYLFTAMLIHKNDLLRILRALNPLGDDISSLYFSRMGMMAKGVVGGQLVIALCQGVVEAGILHVAGIGYFFFFAMILTILSIVPLGGGIVAIPIGIILLLTGNIWQGLLVLIGHFVIITNIDNVLRPRLISKSIRMNSALMMLAVFGGLGLFGFLGLFIGPIIMVLVTSTLQVYLPLAEARRKEGVSAKPQVKVAAS